MTHKLTRLLAMMLAVIMAFSMLLVPVQAASFTDVKDGAWYAAAVEYVNERGWMAGVSESSFAPNKDVTRGMMVTVLARIAGVQTDDSAAVFEDTQEGKWYTGAAAWAAEQGIVSGVGNGRFAPNRAITRQDLCVMLYGYIKAMDIELENTIDRTFSDMDTVAKYAREAVIYCTGTGLISGFEDSTFRPKNTATRAQLAQILMRLDLLVNGEEAPADPMPAQSFDGEAGEDMTVSVNAPEGALPENTKMTVSRVTDEAALAAIQAKVSGQLYAAADITFTKDSAELEPSANVEVQISLDGLEDIQNPTVVHVRADGNVEYVEAELVNTNRSGSEKALRFYARDFSVYAVVSSDDNPFYNVTVNFYVRKPDSEGNPVAGPSDNDSDWELINKQIIRSNQIEAAKDNDTVLIYDPGVPNLNANQSFEGWWRENTFDENTEGISVEYMNAKIKQDYKDGTIVMERNLYAIVYNVVYVEFHDQAGAVLRTDYHHVTDNQKYLINMTYAPFKDNQNFTGWVTRKDVLTLGDYPTYAANPDPVIRNNTEYTVTETLELYPYLQEGYWLGFDTNIKGNNSANGFTDSTSASYTAPVFYAKGTETAPPERPTRDGYDFGGWYSDSGMKNEFSFGSELTKDTVIYAKWTPAQTTYRVIYWTQKRTDNAGIADSAKTWDYYVPTATGVVTSGTATTGSTVTLTSSSSGKIAYNRLGRNSETYSGRTNNGELGYYYKLNTNLTETSKQVKGDGSTVLNVYYDRAAITISFYSTNTYTSTYQLATYTGLYQHDFPNSNYPTISSSYCWKYYDNNNSTTYIVSDGTRPNTFLNWIDCSETWNIYRASASSWDYSSNVYYRTEGLDGVYTLFRQDVLEYDSSSSAVTQYIGGYEYYGFTGIGWNKTGNSMTNSGYTPFTATTDANGAISFTGYEIRTYGANIYYSRNKWNFVYNSNNSVVKTESGVYYEKDISSFANYVPTNGEEGYYFDGWYADPGFTELYDFSKPMPNNDVGVYAKWTLKRYRVELDYTGGDEEAVVTFPGGTQASTWRDDYGAKIQESAIVAARREGYLLLGWYTDPEFKNPFNFNMVMNDDIADMSYAEAPDAQRQGTDKVTGTAWTDVGMSEVRGRITLYAKWRQDPEGTIGIRVNYLGDNLPSTGYFDVNDRPHEWLDPETYADRADAYAQAASVPEVPGEQFLYWEILDEHGDPTGRRVYPGQTWQVRLEEAQRIRKPVPNPNCDHSSLSFVEAKDATCTENGNEAHWICNLCGKCFSDEAHTTEINPTILATGHTWGEWQYQQNGQGGHYHICSVCQTRAGGAHVMEQTAYTAPTTTSEGSKTETCTVCGYSVTTVLPMVEGYTVSFSVPAGVTQPADQTGLEDGTSITLPTEPAGTPSGYIFKGWVTDTVAETTAQPADIQAGGGSYTVHADTVFYALYTKGADQVIYQLADHFTDGGKFILVAQSSISGTTGYAVSNAIVSSSGHYLQLSAVTISGNTCTSSDAASVLWVAAGSDANGWTLYNEAVQKYMGLDSSEYLNLTDSGLAWKYTADKWLDNQIDSESYFYLRYNSNGYYTTGQTSTTTNYVINLYNEILPIYTTEIEGTSVEPGSRSVKYFVNGAQVGSTLTVEDGSSVTVGDGITVTWPTGMTFTDYWVTEQGTNVNFDTVTKYGHGLDSYTVNGADVNFYALFSQTSEGTSSWVKATSISAGDTIVIVAESVSRELTGISSNNGSDAAYSGTPAGTYKLTVESGSDAGTFAFKTESGTYFAKRYNSGSYNNTGFATSSSVDSASSWIVTFDEDGNASIISAALNTRKIAYNTDVGSNHFRCYATSYWESTYQNTQIYKLASGSTTYTTGSQVSGGNAVTEPEEPKADEQPTRGLDVPKPVTEDTVTYQLASSVEVGKTYLIVYGSAATAAGSTTMRAMNSYSATTSGYLRVATPEFSDSTHSVITGVTTDKGTIADCEWTVGEGTMNTDGVYTFYNVSDGTNYYLYESSSSDGNLSATKNPTNTDYTNWAVRRADSADPFVYLTNYYWDSQSSTYFYFLRYSSSGFSNYYESSAIDSARMYLYEKVENTTPKYTLTIHYQYADGTQAHEDYVGEYEAGEEYNVASPTITGFTPNEPLVSGNMPGEDHSRTVYYTANTVSNERWEPTQTIVPGEDYLIAYVINGTPYLLVNYNVSAENHYSYDLEVTSSSGTSTAPLGYLAPATVVTENGTEYVSGVNGAATDLQYCHWIFSANDGGTITSGYESERSLYWNGLLSGTAGVSPQTSGDTWVWVPNSTGNMGAMRNTYTSSSGTSYTFYFYPRTATGAESTSTTTPYAGVSQTSFTNVRLYHKVVTQDTTWTVSFVDEDGVSMTEEGYAPYEVNEGDTVTRPTDPQREDYYFLGWFYKNSEGQEVQYNFGDEVHGDLTLIAHFLYAWEDEYIVTLRAVYGMKNTTGTTHIYWYANDGTTAIYTDPVSGEQVSFGEGAGDRFERLGLLMNTPDAIPTPTTWTGKATNGKLPQIEHRVFLGWARKPTVGSGVTGTAYPDLTEEDLYLKWNAAEGKYYYLPSSDKLTSADIGGANPNEWMQVTQVYADESQPYHDFYAVWASYAYVFHSASGKLEAVEITRTDGVKNTVDLVNKVPSDCLYGGYYTEYGGVKNVTAADMQSAQRTSVQNAYSVDHSGGSAERLVAVNGAVNYTGAMSFSDSGTNVKFWTRAKAYGYGNQDEAPSGDKLVPEVGEVYYLKEVPETYLTTKFLYTYDKDKENEIQDFFMLTLVDDSNYGRVGFRTVENAETVAAAATGEIVDRQALAGYFTLTQKDHDPITVNASSFGLSSGYVGIKQYNDYIAARKSFTLMPAWETYDGVEVNSHGTLKLTVDAAKTSISYENLGTVPVTYTTLYIDISNVSWWKDDKAATMVYFCNDSTSEWVKASPVAGRTNLLECEIPANAWNKIVIVRCNPNYTGTDYFANDVKWNQTEDIVYDSTQNKVTIYDSTDNYSHQRAGYTGVFNP